MRFTVSRVIGWSLAAVDIAVVVFCLYLAFWPFKTITVYGNDEILNPGLSVVAGEAVIYRAHYCKYTTAEATVHRSLVGATTYTFPTSSNNVPRGCATFISRNTLIPAGVLPGKYHLDVATTYQVNPLRSITVRHISQDFMVVSGPGSTTVTTTQTVTSSTATSPNAATPQTTTPTATVPIPSPTPTPGLLSQLISGILKLVTR
jgi:hypothetical protein